MADQKIPQLLSDLSDSERRQFQNAGQRGRADLEREINAFSTTISPELREQILQIYTSPTPSQNQTQTAEGISEVAGAGKTVAGAGVGGLLQGLTGDSSKSGQIIGNLNEIQAAKLFEKDELFEKVQRAIEVRDDETATQLINSISPDDLLATHVDTLEKHLKEAGADETTIAEVRKKHQEIKAKKNNPNKSDGEKQKDHDQQEFDKKRAENLLKALKDPNLKQEDKKRIFNQYITAQQQRNTASLRSLLSKKGKGLLRARTVSIFSRSVRNNLLQTGKNEAKKAQASEDEAFEEIVIPTFEPISIQRPIPTQQDGAQSTPTPRIPSPSGTLRQVKLLSKLLGGGGEAAAVPWLLPAIGIVIGFFVFLISIIVIIIALSQDNNTPPPEVQVSCGDGSAFNSFFQNNSSLFTTGPGGFDNEFNKYFGLHFLDADNNGKLISNVNDPLFATALDNAKSLLTTTCILFGHIGTSYDPLSYINQFGTYITGTKQQIATRQAMPIQLALAYAKDSPSCSYTIKTSGSGQLLVIFINMDACSSTYQQQFVFAKGYAYALLAQQDHLKNSTLFNSFINAPGPYKNPTLLPTASCQSTTDTLQQQKACFADMVGEYLVYPFYIDNTVSKP